MVQRLFQRILVELVREEPRAMRARGGDRSMPSEAVAQYMAAGPWGLLSWWLDARTSLSVDEVDGLFRQLAIPSIQAR